VQTATELRIARVDEQDLPCFGVLQYSKPAAELALARIHHPDRDDLVSPREAEERSFPARLADEIGDHDHQRASARALLGRGEELGEAVDAAASTVRAGGASARGRDSVLAVAGAPSGVPRRR